MARVYFAAMSDARSEAKARRALRDDSYAVGPELNEDLTPADIIVALNHLRFQGGFATVRVDRQARDYLVHCLRRR